MRVFFYRMKFEKDPGQKPAGQEGQEPKKLDVSKTVYGSWEGGMSHELKGSGEIKQPERPPLAAEGLLAEEIGNMRSSAEAMKYQPSEPVGGKTFYGERDEGGLADRLSDLKKKTAEKEQTASQGLEMIKEANMLAAGLEDLKNNRPVKPEFGAAVERLQGESAGRLQQFAAQDRKFAPSNSEYVSAATQEERRRLAAYQELLDRFDKQD